LLEEIRESLIDRYGKSDAALLYTDYDLNQNNITNLDKRSENFILIGGGGTSFKPAFKWIEENLNECLGLIYITDGYGEYPEQEPNFQVLWVLNDDCDVPFGLKFII
jgi:predicted metal-dependent peptidase